ncbi:hypothetical protein IAS59_001249 [Cryptococcus gattii]
MAALTKRDLDDPTYGPPPQRFRLTRLNELESYMEAKRAEVTQMMANVDMGWKDISGSNFKWSEVTTPTVSRQSESLFVSDPVNKVKVLTFCQYGCSHQDHLLECTIPSIPSNVDYTPDLSALKPIPQVALNCLSALQQDIGSYADTLLSKQPRSKMVPSQKAKYDTAISSAMEEIVERSRTKWEEMTAQLNDSTVAPDGLDSVLMSRAASNYFTLRALLARHNEPPATNKKESRASATSVQKDREEAKKWEKNVEEWHASRRTSETIDVSNDDKTSQQLDKVATQIEAATVSDTPTIAPQLTELEKLFIANGLEPQEHFDWFEEVQEHLPLPESTATTSQTSSRTGGASASAISKPSRGNSLPKVGRLEEIRKLRSWR